MEKLIYKCPKCGCTDLMVSKVTIICADCQYHDNKEEFIVVGESK